MKQKRKSKNRVSGFTLIELLVVISIIGFVSSLFLSIVHQARIKARDIRRTLDSEQVTKALLLYYQDHGKFPCHKGGNNADLSTGDTFFLTPLVAGGYMVKMPHDPGEPDYRYEYFTLHSPGKPCGEFAFLGMYTESRATCPSGGAYSEGDHHCHILVPEPLPPPCLNAYFLDPPTGASDPYNPNGYNNKIVGPTGCLEWADTTNDY